MVRIDVKFKMIMRNIRRYFKKNFYLLINLGVISERDLEYLKNLFFSKNYVPSDGIKAFKTFNSQFKDYAFSFVPFCFAYVIFMRK